VPQTAYELIAQGVVSRQTDLIPLGEVVDFDSEVTHVGLELSVECLELRVFLSV